MTQIEIENKRQVEDDIATEVQRHRDVMQDLLKQKEAFRSRCDHTLSDGETAYEAGFIFDNCALCGQS